MSVYRGPKIIIGGLVMMNAVDKNSPVYKGISAYKNVLRATELLQKYNTKKLKFKKR